MQPDINILIADDEKHIREGLSEALKYDGYNTILAQDGLEAIKKAKETNIHIAIIDLKMPGLNGHEVLKRLLEINKNIQVIILTGHGTIEDAVKAMQNGAYNFLTKPVDINHLSVLIKKALQEQNIKIENIKLKTQINNIRDITNIIGKSKAIKQVIEKVKQVAPTKATVLITGESGTGKELIAGAIHKLSNRSNGPYIKVHCAALTESLLESELFGHEKGAFTGAIATKKGRFELANGGTIFLDEIGEISPSLQVKLLRVLQEREFERVGGTKPIKVDVRIISATNKDLYKEVQEGRFREDLYYRLKVIEINIPPLRERKEDIPLLVNTFITEFARENNKNITGITKEAMEILISYSWPGNIRQLKNTVESMVVLCNSDKITKDDIPDEIKKHKDIKTLKIEIPQKLRDIEKEAIIKTLKYTNWNKQSAASLLGITRKTLYNKIKEYGIENRQYNI